jgi:hypothetical protein
VSKDRSVELSELAARVQTAPQGRRAKSDCRNPECSNGLTPGISASGGGTKGAPLFGAGGVGPKKLMRWGWVPCLVCNPSPDQRKAGARYRDLKSVHAPENTSKLNELIEQNKQFNERLSEMLKQNVAMTDTFSRMSMQVASLLEDNAKMRLELAKPASILKPVESV